MKKFLTLILFSFLFCACDVEIKDTGIVKSVKEETVYRNFKYQIELRNCDMRGFTSIYIYTNTRYQVGDTVKLYKMRQ